MNVLVIALIFSLLSEKVNYMEFLKDVPGKFIYMYNKTKHFFTAFAG